MVKTKLFLVTHTTCQQPGNMMLTDNDQVLLADLGSVSQARVAVSTRREAVALQELAAVNCTSSYRAPELFEVSSAERGVLGFRGFLVWGQVSRWGFQAPPAQLSPLYYDWLRTFHRKSGSNWFIVFCILVYGLKSNNSNCLVRQYNRSWKLPQYLFVISYLVTYIIVIGRAIRFLKFH